MAAFRIVDKVISTSPFAADNKTANGIDWIVQDYRRGESNFSLVVMVVRMDVNSVTLENIYTYILKPPASFIVSIQNTATVDDYIITQSAGTFVKV